MNLTPTKLLNGILLGSAMLFAASCGKNSESPGYEFMPDMYRNQAYKSYEPSGLFGDSTSARTPVAGTVPRDYTFFTYPSSNEGYEASGRDLKNPFEASEVNIAKGKKLYDNFCMHCHGAKGAGDGSLIATGKFPPPPSYIAGVSSRGGNMRDLSDGKIFHTITYGINLMGPHASQLTYDERWLITLYVKELFKAAAATTPAAAADTTTTAQN